MRSANKVVNAAKRVRFSGQVGLSQERKNGRVLWLGMLPALAASGRGAPLRCYTRRFALAANEKGQKDGGGEDAMNIVQCDVLAWVREK